MVKPSRGDMVLIDYTIRVVDNGKEQVVDTTSKEVARKHGIYDDKKYYGPIAVVLGKSLLIQAVEEALYEMEEGETREIEAPPEKAYGKRNENLVIKVAKKRLREAGIRPVVGEEVTANGRKGRIVRVTERFAYIDFNHPLAGKTLRITLTLRKVLRDDKEKAQYLASRILSLPPDSVNVEEEDGTLALKLPPNVLLVKDLDALLLELARNIYEMTAAKRLRIIVDIEFRREEGQAGEAQEPAEPAGEEKPSEETSSTEEAEKAGPAPGEAGGEGQG